MGGKYGIKETKEFLDLGFSLWGAVDAAGADDKYDFNDMAYLIPIIPKLEPGIGDIGLMPKEMADLDDEDAKELLDFAAAKTGLLVGDPLLVKKINSTLQALIYVAKAVAAWREKAPVPAEESPTDGA